MDPLSIVSGCAGLITAIGSLTVSINTFVRSVREARSDLDRVSRELHSLRNVLELIQEDAIDDMKLFPPTIQHHISVIVSNCSSVIAEVQTCITKYADGRIKSRASWVTNGQGDMEKLRSSLEAHKSALELALDMLALALTKDIKTDTTELRNDTTAIKDDTAQILQEIAQLQARLPDTAAAPNDYILQRFLEDMATYTEATLDVDVEFSDRASYKAPSFIDEVAERPTVAASDGPPNLCPSDPSGIVGPQKLNAESNDEENAAQIIFRVLNNRSHTYWPRPSHEQPPTRPCEPGPSVKVNQQNHHDKYPTSQILGQPILPYLLSTTSPFPAQALPRAHELTMSSSVRPTAPPSPPSSQRTEGQTNKDPAKYEEECSLSDENHTASFRGNVVLDIPAPKRILDLVPHAAAPECDEFTHSRFTWITCHPKNFASCNYTLRPTLFGQPRQIRFILVVQVDPDDCYATERWNLIHDSLVYAQERLKASGEGSDIWTKVLVHVHLPRRWIWADKSWTNFLKEIGLNQPIRGLITKLDHKRLKEPLHVDTRFIAGQRVYCTMSEVSQSAPNT
ncbi:hypothetical protein BFJ69_g17167 [Fusarium oxysporum]|uniref:chitin synthase n=1 Tax=Fusarium oxysporum TaxID=5507 RepID=A0A420M913_FUSOX|nr:hypothetical protein BFJ69_g17167 [Fusarium oxysporum]